MFSPIEVNTESVGKTGDNFVVLPSVLLTVVEIDPVEAGEPCMGPPAAP